MAKALSLVCKDCGKQVSSTMLREKNDLALFPDFFDLSLSECKHLDESTPCMHARYAYGHTIHICFCKLPCATMVLHKDQIWNTHTIVF
jgi:hypothetical protein